MNVPSTHGPARVVGSASIWMLGLVAGPARTVPVLHAGDDAVYLDLEGTCLGILGARAVQVPCGVRTQLTHVPGPPAGTPVVGYRAGAVAEVVGEAGLLVDEQDAGALGDALVMLLADEGLRDRLAERAKPRAARFSWDRAADDTLAVYRSVR